jgi:hypothetical protein
VNMSLGFKIIIWAPQLDYQVGGIVVLHNLAKDLIDLGYRVMLYNPQGHRYDNPFCNQFADVGDIDDRSVVVYPEVVEGNPLKALNVVRWMLCDIGVHTSPDIYQSWNGNDLVFHFSSFNSAYNAEDLEILYTLWIDPAIENKGLKRSGSCYLFRKASQFHEYINMIHPKDAVLIDHCSNEEIFRIFNEKEIFFNYDPHSYYDAMAVMCGCPAVVYPLAGISKLDWLKSKASFQAFNGIRDDMAGIAYGLHDLKHAMETLPFARKEQQEAVEFGRGTVKTFCDRIQAYFFANGARESFNTLDKMVDRLRWGEKQRSVKVWTDTRERIKSLEDEIKAMKTSKFWKAREWYFANIKSKWS